MTSYMSAVVITSPHQAKIEKRPIPTPGPHELLIRVHRAGICGSDMHIYEGSNPFVSYPRIPGHELAGEVVSWGSEVTTAPPPGTRVVVDPVISCGKCIACRTGHPNVCRNLQVVGVHRDGGFAPYLTVPATNVHPIPDGLTWEEAVFIEPYSIAANVRHRLQVTPDDIVLIIGAGIIGTLSLQVMRLTGARTIICDISESALERARRMGADETLNTAGKDLAGEVLARTDGEGATAVVDAVGAPSLFESIVRCSAPGARIVLLGFSSTPTPIPQAEIIRKELSILGSRLNNRKFPEIVSLLAEGKLNPSPLLAGVHPLDEAPSLLERAAEEHTLPGKVLLTCEEE
ncbi:Alcohol dehydrogenase GroES domain protein [Spirochaeta thermophila DSM 6578]|uniref:Alcohol dehydrogenase GroES domain protein n=1 Tax=Winmispira thermophila (strain ATCC 700085 / DSM 6578 / Z-1203) TaxID=869211 RepID=G0GA60_WINT7|nr:zinc-binding alcohol dehydrogenase family protein [Spirochaeta thermophila]AEJ60896.1 Alcohol dehydrogenase GroES domain protein [Spirochaeta thermophila DSM 6578]